MKQFESFRLDTPNECLWRGEVRITLPPKPFAVLRYLVENPGRLITHNELLDALWPDTYVQPQVLRTYMLDLRKALGDDPAQPRFIQTLPKRGYCFVAPVRDGAGAEPATVRAQSPEPETPAKLVNREEELACLKAQFERAAGGERRTIFVTGEAGIGKTALIDDFCRPENFPSPACVVRGQCVQGFGAKEEYYPIKEALSALCGSADGAMAVRILAKMAPFWLPGQGREEQTAADSGPRQGLPGDLCASLEQFASERLLVLVFDDLHWADTATLDLISALARRRARAKLMVLGTYRPCDVETKNPLKELKQDLLMRHLCIELALAPLGKTAVCQLVSRELGQELLPPGLGDFVHRRSEGNPLFVIAILNHLIAQRTLVRKRDGPAPAWEQRAPFAEPDAAVPSELAQMIGLEIERLSPEDQRLLEAGSLIDVAFPAWAVAAALEKDPAETEEDCDALARRLYFVHRAGEDELPDGTCSAFYVFAHGLYREVLYQRQAAGRRARRHTRIAERLGQLFAGREATVSREMAMHYEAAGDWRRACTALRAAALYARERLAHAEAAALFEQALSAAANLDGAERQAAESGIRGELAAAGSTPQQGVEQPSGPARKA